jgi:plasmid stabilization system protein ParE
MKRSELHPEAEQDILDAIDFYNGRRNGLGETFFEHYRKTRRLIERFPAGSPRYRYYPEIRRISIEDFPYSMYYLNLEEVLFILAVIHDSRRPLFWKDRLTSPPPPQT